MPHNTIPRHPDYVEHTRRAHARARVRLHEIRELRALELAVHALDDTVARLLEARVAAPHHILPHAARGDLHRAREAARLERPVGYDAQLAQAEQHRAALLLRVELIAERLQRRPQQGAADDRPRARLRRRADGSQQRVHRALHRLQRDVAGEAVADDHVGGAGPEREALDVADEVEVARGGELGVGGHDVARAARRLLAVGEQRHTRALEPVDRLHEGGAHMRELDEVLGPHLDVGADVEQQERRLGGRHHDRQRRTVDAPRAPDLEEAGGQHRAGRAAGDERVRPTRRDRPDGLDDRGLRRGTDGTGGVGGLGDRHRGVDDLDAGRRVAEPRRRAEQQDVDAALGREGRAARHFAGPEIGSVRVQRDGDPVGHDPGASSGRARDRGRRPRSRRPPCRRRSRSAGRRGAGAAADGTAGRSSAPAPRSCAATGAGSCARATASASGRP
jgi:hypothetical protein